MSITFYKKTPSLHKKEIKKIGLFDSGVGGLSVLKPLLSAFPKKEFIYYADNLYWPYGQKTNKELQTRCQYIQDFLISLNVDLLVIACNTMSALVMDQPFYKNIPVFNVILPTVNQAIQKTQNNKIGILATKSTVKSQIYPTCLFKEKTNLQICQNPSPLLSAFVEQKLDSSVSSQTLIQTYLQPLIEKKIDTLILGCTHYSFLISEIQFAIDSSVNIVDSSTALIETLLTNKLLHNNHSTSCNQLAKYQIYTSQKDTQYTHLIQKLLHK